MSVHAKRQQKMRGCSAGRPTLACIALFTGLFFGFKVISPQTVFADTPSVTDFGLDEAERAWSSFHKNENAMFLTLYADGSHQVEFHKVHGDAVVLFTGAGRSGWRLNHGLMWYVQMPVYVREIPSSRERNCDEL